MSLYSTAVAVSISAARVRSAGMQNLQQKEGGAKITAKQVLHGQIKAQEMMPCTTQLGQQEPAELSVIVVWQRHLPGTARNQQIAQQALWMLQHLLLKATRFRPP